MKLIDILVQELPKRGGWPEGANEAVQDDDGAVKFFDSDDLQFSKYGNWRGSARGDFYCDPVNKITGYLVAPSNGETIVTRQQYEEALKQPVWDGAGVPPVGVECEWCESNGQWTAVKIVYLSEWVIVMRGVKEGLGKGVEIAKDLVMDKMPEFRPIRSGRDEAITAMLKYEPAATTCIVGSIYDAIAAGKVPGVKLSD